MKPNKCTRFDTTCQTVCLTDPSNDQLVKDEGAQIFYSIWLQTKPIGIGANCEIPHNPSLTMRHQRLEPMTGLWYQLKVQNVYKTPLNV